MNCTKRGPALVLAVAALFVASMAQAFGQQDSQKREEPAMGPSIVLSEVRPGRGLARIFLLSDIDSGLAGTAFDTPVFQVGEKGTPPDSSDSKAALFVCAGAHENEIAGILAAYWLIEKVRVHGAKLFVMPRANAAGATWSLQNPKSPRILQAIPGISRTFRYGARLSDPAHETVSDPPLFSPPAAPAGFRALAGQEMRNLNREYPGSTDSAMTARLAYAITLLLKKENISIAIDLHEASASSHLGYSIVTRAEFLDEAALAVLDLEETAGKSFRLEESKPEFAGYSHWEWGKLGIHAFLVETFNPAQPSDDPTIDQFNNSKAPLAGRVYAHLCAVQALIANAGESLGMAVVVEGLPSSDVEVEDWLEAPLFEAAP